MEWNGNEEWNNGNGMEWNGKEWKNGMEWKEYRNGRMDGMEIRKK